MFKNKGFITGVAVTLAIGITSCVVLASTGEKKISVLFDHIKILVNGSEDDLEASNDSTVEPLIDKGTTYVPIRAVSNVFGKMVDWDSENKKVLVDDPMPMADSLPIDTHYVSLSDVNSDKMIEHTMNDSQVLNHDNIFEKTDGYNKVALKNPNAMILIDEKGNYFTVSEATSFGVCGSDIHITKYDMNGNELKSRKYGGGDFDWANAAKYNAKMGIVISGISQSKDGDFANDNNLPFVACINPETLEVKWTYPVQVADSVYHVSDQAVYVVHNEGEKYDGNNELKLSVVKLDSEGKKLWASEPLSQWICGITEITDGSIIVVQMLTDSQANEASGLVNHFSKEGTKLSTFTADCYGNVTATDDGGFISVSVRNIKTLPQPAYISAIWYDTETVATKYDKNFNLEWRKTYDNSKDAIGLDTIIPQKDGSLVIGEE